MEELFNSCQLCPRNCRVNRNNNEIGFCKASNEMVIGGYRLHMWEEPIITGKHGSGTIFFSYCNLGCVYCQNYDISINNKGEKISVERFSDICIELQNMSAANINLVTPTHYIPLIRDGIILAKKKGLKVPVVYNTSCYEKTESLKLLDGLIDIYLPDFKYHDNNLGKYSNVNDYFDVAKVALDEMFKQVGKPKYKNGILQKGVIVRHLLLPTHKEDSKKIISYLFDNYHNDIILSIMNQYTPIRKVKYTELNKKVSSKEYDDLINYAYDLGIRKCFTQEKASQSESFIPSFKGDLLI